MDGMAVVPAAGTVVVMAVVERRLTKLRAGLYRHEATGRYIVSTSWDGPCGGTMWRWEHASDDRGALTIDGLPRLPASSTLATPWEVIFQTLTM